MTWWRLPKPGDDLVGKRFREATGFGQITTMNQPVNEMDTIDWPWQTALWYINNGDSKSLLAERFPKCLSMSFFKIGHPHLTGTQLLFPVVSAMLTQPGAELEACPEPVIRDPSRRSQSLYRASPSYPRKAG